VQRAIISGKLGVEAESGPVVHGILPKMAPSYQNQILMRFGPYGTVVDEPNQGRGDERFAAGDLHAAVADVDGGGHT